MPYIQCNGADLYYEESGSGPPIVLLHGVLHSLRFYEPQLAGLSENYRTIAVDFRGHGRSEKTDLGHTVAQYARDIHAFLEEFDLEDVVLVGWSMGAFVAWDYVEQFGSERIRGLVDIEMEASRFQWPYDEHGLTDLQGLMDTLAVAQNDPTSLIDRMTEQVCKDPSAETRRLQFDEISRTPGPIRSAILFDEPRGIIETSSATSIFRCWSALVQRRTRHEGLSRRCGTSWTSPRTLSSSCSQTAAMDHRSSNLSDSTGS